VYDQHPRQLDIVMQPGSMEESVTVTADSAATDTRTVTRDEIQRRGNERAQQSAPSVNVQNLQRRAAGVLPVRIEVPRAGTSHRFVKPLVIDEETVVSFRYRRR
jgi:hypothetical protein